VRVGVPLVKRIHAANPGPELRVIALTCMIGSDTEETPLQKAQELGIEYPVALSAMFGEWTPYLNLNKMPGLTYAYVIGRSGGVVWRGDTSRDTEEFIEAVRTALAAPPARALFASADEALAEAVSAYALGDFARARKLTEKVAGKFAKKKGEEAERIRAEAAALVELVDGTLADLAAALDQAWEARDPASFASAANALLEAFPKSDAAGTVRPRLAEDPEFAASVESWSTWIELRDERPPAFPERREKLEARYAKSLETYLKQNATGPGTEQVRAWLERFSAVEE